MHKAGRSGWSDLYTKFRFEVNINEYATIKRDDNSQIENIGLIIINYLTVNDMNKFLKIKLLGLGLLISVLGCNKKDELKQNLKPLNSFSMNINDQLWQPSIIGNDSCSVAYTCEWSRVDQIPFYTITAAPMA